jgi:hypothetical protein
MIADIFIQLTTGILAQIFYPVLIVGIYYFSKSKFIMFYSLALLWAVAYLIIDYNLFLHQDKICAAYQRDDLMVVCRITFSNVSEPLYDARLTAKKTSSGLVKNVLDYTYISPSSFAALGLIITSEEKLNIIESDDYTKKLEEALAEFNLLKKKKSETK